MKKTLTDKSRKQRKKGLRKHALTISRVARYNKAMLATPLGVCVAGWAARSAPGS